MKYGKSGSPTHLQLVAKASQDNDALQYVAVLFSSDVEQQVV